jgi:hypothetical protein
MKNSYIINKQLYYKFYADPYYAEVMSSFSFGSNNFNSTFVIPDGEDVVVAAPYNYDSAWVYDFHECGAAVARYELRTMQRKALKYFNDQPGPSTGVNIMCFQKTSDGNLYLVYRETDSEYNPTMTAVKMDRNLNVIWKRYCYEPLSLKVDPNWSCYSDILKDENGNEKGIYIAGYSIRNVDYKGGIFFFFLTDDSLDDVGEGNMEVRPYSYYPNPAKDQLHLNYSPDVQPTKIELYDLQGRLVRTQSNGLENVNMQNFAAGQYLMRVILENGKVYTDKIVKERIELLDCFTCPLWLCFSPARLTSTFMQIISRYPSFMASLMRRLIPTLSRLPVLSLWRVIPISWQSTLIRVIIQASWMPASSNTVMVIAFVRFFLTPLRFTIRNKAFSMHLTKSCITPPSL